MTTLILDRRTKTLYADRKETYGKGKLHTYGCKIYPLILEGKKFWGWVAIAGDYAEWTRFMYWISSQSTIKCLWEKDKPELKEIAGFAVGLDGTELSFTADGTPLPVTEPYASDGVGYLQVIPMMDGDIPIPRIFEILSKRTAYCSSDFDFIEYGKKNPKIQHSSSIKK